MKRDTYFEVDVFAGVIICCVHVRMHLVAICFLYSSFERKKKKKKEKKKKKKKKKKKEEDDGTAG